MTIDPKPQVLNKHCSESRRHKACGRDAAEHVHIRGLYTQVVQAFIDGARPHVQCTFPMLGKEFRRIRFVGDTIFTVW